MPGQGVTPAQGEGAEPPRGCPGAVSADLHEVADHRPFPLARGPQVSEFDPFSLNPAVAGVLVAEDRKGRRPGA